MFCVINTLSAYVYFILDFKGYILNIVNRTGTIVAKLWVKKLGCWLIQSQMQELSWQFSG